MARSSAMTSGASPLPGEPPAPPLPPPFMPLPPAAPAPAPAWLWVRCGGWGPAAPGGAAEVDTTPALCGAAKPAPASDKGRGAGRCVAGGQCEPATHAHGGCGHEQCSRGAPAAGVGCPAVGGPLGGWLRKLNIRPGGRWGCGRPGLGVNGQQDLRGARRGPRWAACISDSMDVTARPGRITHLGWRLPSDKALSRRTAQRRGPRSRTTSNCLGWIVLCSMGVVKAARLRNLQSSEAATEHLSARGHLTAVTSVQLVVKRSNLQPYSGPKDPANQHIQSQPAFGPHQSARSSR